MSRRRLAGVLVLGFLLASCTSGPDETEESSPTASPPPVADTPDEDDDEIGGTLRIGLGVDPMSIDPRFVVDDEGELIVDALFDPLVRVDQRMRVVPAAAEGWEISDDGREFTFTLREATFHDGTPVTAEDFQRTFERLADATVEPASFLSHLLEPLEGFEQAAEGEGFAGVEVVDDRTLRLHLRDPQPAFLTVLSDPSLVPLPPDADDDPEAFGDEPIGNGPFLMAEPRDPGAFLRLSAFEEHPEPPLLDEVLFQIYPEDSDRTQRWQDLVDGQLHLSQVPPEHADDAVELFGRSPDGYRGPGYLDGITTTVYLYGFDTSREPYDDPLVRRALSLAIDRDALAEDVMQGTRAAATSLVPPPMPGSAATCEHCRHDPTEAAALLAEAEIELESLTLTHNRGRTHAAIAERMAGDIEAALDVDVDLAARDLQPFIQAVRRGDVPVFRLGWSANEPDASALLYPLFHSSQVGLDNLTRYEDEQVDELLELARSSPDRSIALGANREAERAILEDAPALPLLWYRHTHAVAPAVQDLYYSPLGRLDLPRIWIDPDA